MDERAKNKIFFGKSDYKADIEKNNRQITTLN